MQSYTNKHDENNNIISNIKHISYIPNVVALVYFLLSQYELCGYHIEF